MSFLLENEKNRGNISLILLFIVALILAITTLISYISFNKDFDGKSGEISDIISRVEFGKKYVVDIIEISGKKAILNAGIEGDLKNKFMEIVEERDYRIMESGNFFGKVRNREFRFDKEEGIFVLEIKELFVQSDEGASKIKSNFNIRIEFNDKGEVVKRSA